MNILGKRRTFIVISPRDGQAREYGFFPRLLCLIMLGGFGFVGALGYFAHAQGLSFYQPSDQKVLVALQDENKILLHTLEQTREEVQQLGEAMDQLKATEDRLRAHHELEPLEMGSLAADQESGGVGGVEDFSAEFASLPPQKQRMMHELGMRIDYLKRMTNLQEKSFEEIERKFEETNVQYLPTISPVRGKMSWLSSPFGWRRDPFTGRRAFHRGVDFAGRRGAPIYATADGFVSYAGKDRYLGNTITLDHRKKELDEQGQPYARLGGYQTEYGHLDKILVKQGQQVKRGQQIGTMGNTGRSTGPHLHYGVRLRDRELSKHRGYKDPEDFIFDFDQSEGDMWAAGG